MSKFLTAIKVDVEGALKLLPARATPLDIYFNPAESVLEIEWDDDDLVSGFTFPVEFSTDLLRARKLPKGVKRRAPDRQAAPAAERKFVLTRSDPLKQLHELPGGATTLVQVSAAPGVATPTPRDVDQASGKGGKHPA